MNFRNIALLSTRNYILDSRKLNSVILISLLLLTFTFSIKYMTGHEAYGATTCANIPISAATANGAQSTNPASEAVDNDAATRWSNEGLGSWIRLDLGSQKTVCSVDISWFNGNQRVNTFEIAVSNDGNTFTKIFSSKSSGTTTAPEKYDVTDSPGRYVKITVTGNTQSDWVSINEIDVFGTSSTPLPSDTTKPTVTSTSPGGGTSNIQVNSVIKATFSEPMLSSSVSTSTFTLRIADTTTTLGGVVSLSSDGKTGSFDPTANLASSTRYVATISTGAKDLAGNALSESKKWSFTTAVAQSPPPTSSSCDKNAPISAVTSNAAQSGNPASAAVDNNLDTRWSNEGLGSWIRLDLGSEKTVCSLDIAWFKGSERVNSFDVLVSNDGSSFTKIFSGKSSGTTTATEKYNVPDTKGRYVRITFTGNTVNDWVGINEIDVFSTDSTGTTTNHSPVASNQNVATTLNTGKSITLTASDSDTADKLTYSIVKQPSHGTLTGTPPSVTYKPATGYTGSDSFTFKVNDGKVDSNTATISITIGSTSSGGTDKFGIKKIYPLKSGGEEWYMDMNNPNGDNRFNPQNTITKNSDGSWKMKSSKVRMGVYTSSGYSSSNIPTLDHSKIASKGYMLAPNDWKNFEMTMYTKVNTAGSDDNFAPYGRGGRHTGGGAPEGCEGSAYKGDLFFSGKVRFAKEQWHVSYVFTNYETGTSSIKGKWVGFKFVLYNFQDSSGKTAVKMEFWLDENNKGTFVKVDENVDRGGWGNEGRECNGAPDQIVTWGGPIATFRWDTATDVDFKNLSVREIQPPQ